MLPLEIGILSGIGLNMIFILYHAARPNITVETLTTPGGAEYLMITPDRCLIFPSVDYVRNLVTKHSLRQNLPVVIDCTHVYGADFTAATVIENLTQDFSKRGQHLFFYNLKPSVCTVFEGLSPVDFTVYYQEQQLDELLHRKDKKLAQLVEVWGQELWEMSIPRKPLHLPVLYNIVIKDCQSCIYQNYLCCKVRWWQSLFINPMCGDMSLSKEWYFKEACISCRYGAHEKTSKPSFSTQHRKKYLCLFIQSYLRYIQLSILIDFIRFLVDVISRI